MCLNFLSYTETLPRGAGTNHWEHAVKVGIINVTGYAGMELARLLHRHPDVELTSVTGRSAAGKQLGEVLPHLADIDLTITEELSEGVDFVFSALPQVASAEAIVPLARQGIKVVDISADFRLKDAAEYQQWYGNEHPAPDLLGKATYGLTEWHRAEIERTLLVANPRLLPHQRAAGAGPGAAGGDHHRRHHHRQQVRGIRRRAQRRPDVQLQ